MDSPLLESLELEMLNLRYKIAGISAPKAVPGEGSYLPGGSQLELSKDIAIVVFDNDSQFELETARFNESRCQEILSTAVDIVEKGQPALVVVDLDLRGAASPDLIMAFRHYQNIVLALFGNLEGSADLPAAEFLSHAVSYGYHELPKENDGTVYRIPTREDDIRKSQDALFVRERSLNEAIILAWGAAKGLDTSEYLNTLSSSASIYIGHKRVDFPEYSLVRVLEPNFDPSVFANKIVFIGSKLKARKHDFSFVKAPLRGVTAEVLVHADQFRTIIERQQVVAFPRQLSCYLLILFSSLFCALASCLPLGKRSLATVIFSVIIVCLAQIVFQLFNTALPVVAPLAMIGSGFILGTVVYLDTDLRQRNKELAATRQMMQLRAEEERKRISEELHDETLPALSSIARMIDDMGEEFHDFPQPRQMREKLDDTIQEMRRVINDLHPSVLETMGFVPALENLTGILAKDMRADVTFVDRSANVEQDLPDFYKLQLYRIVQEVLNNVRKHSLASCVQVAIVSEGDELNIAITDNGKGIDPSAIRPDSHGLLNIKHRAQLIGAAVEWGVPPGFRTGTAVTVKMSLEDLNNAVVTKMEGKA